MTMRSSKRCYLRKVQPVEIGTSNPVGGFLKGLNSSQALPSIQGSAQLDYSFKWKSFGTLEP